MDRWFDPELVFYLADVMEELKKERMTELLQGSTICKGKNGLWNINCKRKNSKDKGAR